jgi:hypothetical protein
MLPERVAHHGLAQRHAETLVGVLEESTGGGLDAEHVEVAGAHLLRVRAIGAVRAAQADRLGLEANRVHSGEDRVLIAQVRVGRGRDRVEALAVVGAADVHELVHVAHAVRRHEQQRVRDREDRRVGAEANRQRQRRGDRVERRSREHADGVANLAGQPIEHESSCE